MNLQVYGEEVKIESAGSQSVSIYVTQVDVDEIIGQIGAKEILKALADGGDMDEIVNFVTENTGEME